MYLGREEMSSSNDSTERIIELENALEGLLRQCQKTSDSMGHKNTRRIFASDDFMMVWEAAGEALGVDLELKKRMEVVGKLRDTLTRLGIKYVIDIPGSKLVINIADNLEFEKSIL